MEIESVSENALLDRIRQQIADYHRMSIENVEVIRTHDPGQSNMGKSIFQYRARYSVPVHDGGSREYWGSWKNVSSVLLTEPRSSGVIFHKPSDEQRAAIERMFEYVPVQENQADRMRGIRMSAKQLALMIATYVPAGVEQEQAINRIQEAVMWACKGISQE